MTDDFRLFGDDDDDRATPLDADIALITAYLARELSPMQVLGVEERLASDADFRANMQPLIDAWAAPVGSLAGSAIHSSQLTAEEKAASWDRFQKLDPDATTVAADTRRRIPMKRVAAIVGLTALPVFSFAQAVTYAARHENAPGHAIAARIVAAFTTQAPVIDSSSAPRVVQDVPIAAVLTPAGAVPIPELPPVPSNPDRAGVIALVKRYQPAVAQGDTIVEYVLLVVDATNKYVWSTVGNGNLLIEVGADPRTAVERKAYNFNFSRELVGWSMDSVQRAEAEAPRGAVAKAKPLTDDSAVAAKILSDGSEKPVVATRKTYGASDKPVVATRKTYGAKDSAGGNSYVTGWKFTVGASPLNDAPGLQEPGNGESGIQGIRSASVSRADTYQFDRGQLAPRTVGKSLKVVVVQLTPGTSWMKR